MTVNGSRRRPLRTGLALFAGFAVIVVLSTVTDPRPKDVRGLIRPPAG
jgi:hypothetical protein